MGLNMPAKTVVFTAVKKWDGDSHRYIGSGEYIQVSEDFCCYSLRHLRCICSHMYVAVRESICFMLLAFDAI